jgi:pteridine reductase
MSMQDKVVLVTGGAKRVGSAMCRLLHREGARIVIHYRSSSTEARALADDLERIRPRSACIVQADLLDTAGAVPRMISEALACFGQLDALIQNASSFFPTPLGGIGEEDFHDLVGTNLKAPLFVAQAAAPALARRSGCIVNLIDIHADRPLKGYLVYSMAKAGLAGLTRSLAIELGPAVRVNGIAPGAVMWPEGDANFDPVEQERIIGQTPLGRAGSPEDIASAARYLICEAPYVTGQILAVDGGRSLHL